MVNNNMHPFASQYYWKAQRKHCWSFEETSIKTDVECLLYGRLKVQIAWSRLSLWYLLGSVSMWKTQNYFVIHKKEYIK